MDKPGNVRACIADTIRSVLSNSELLAQDTGYGPILLGLEERVNVLTPGRTDQITVFDETPSKLIWCTIKRSS